MVSVRKSISCLRWNTGDSDTIHPLYSKNDLTLSLISHHLGGEGGGGSSTTHPLQGSHRDSYSPVGGSAAYGSLEAKRRVTISLRGSSGGGGCVMWDRAEGGSQVPPSIEVQSVT